MQIHLVANCFAFYSQICSLFKAYLELLQFMVHCNSQWQIVFTFFLSATINKVRIRSNILILNETAREQRLIRKTDLK